MRGTTPSPAFLRITVGEGGEREVPLEGGEARLGRDPTLEVSFPEGRDSVVSRLHAVIRWEGEGYLLEDLGSTNGTWVNGQRVGKVLLRHGDEVSLGRLGPRATFLRKHGMEDTPTVVADFPQRVPGSPQRPVPAPFPPPPSPSPEERPSQMVRRIVEESLAKAGGRSLPGPLWLSVGALVALAGGALAAVLLLGREDSEQRLREFAREYRERVLLVEVGVTNRGEYVKLGNGTGFVADERGFIITNKHVLHGHLYSPSHACAAESFRRQGIPFAEALVISVWQGGTRFRQNPASTLGDRGLGFSTEHGTLRLVAVSPDNLLPARSLQCSDFFTGRPFSFQWRAHAHDNNDLAVLRAASRLPAIPLASGVPEEAEWVMVLGFPSGVTPLETNDAEPLSRFGRVLRAHETIQVDAAVIPGNSGGPLINSRGEVTGVTTRYVSETLNMAVKIEHARRLLDRVLLEEAK